MKTDRYNLDMTSTIKTENNFAITTPPIWEKCVYQKVYLKFAHLINTTVPTQFTYIDGSLQERHNSSALAMELRLLHEFVDMVSYRYPDSRRQKVDHLDLFDLMLLRRSSKRGLSLSCFQNDLCQIMKISTKGRPLSTPKRHGYLCRVHLVPKATTHCIKENKERDRSTFLAARNVFYMNNWHAWTLLYAVYVLYDLSVIFLMSR